MRICVLTTGHPPADDRVYYKELRSLLIRYADLHLAAPGTPEEWEMVDPRAGRISLGSSRSISGRLLAIPRAIWAMMRLQPDVIHFHDYELLLAVPFFRLLTPARLVYDIHEMYPDQVALSDRIPGWMKPLGRFAVWHFERMIARMCHWLITADKPVADSFRHTGVPTDVVYNYPCLELFEPDKDRVAAIRQEREGRLILIYQGSMGIDRGLMQMIEAMVHVVEKYPKGLLLLVGNLNPTLRARVEALVNTLGVGKHVEMTGWVDHRDVVNWVSAADLGLIPFLPVEKYRKNIPVKQFEYMACSLPILAADLPPIRLYLGRSGAGLLYPSGNLGALVAGMKELLAHPAKRAEMAGQGRHAVEEQWNWERMEAVLLSVYDRLSAGMEHGKSIRRG